MALRPAHTRSLRGQGGIGRDYNIGERVCVRRDGRWRGNGNTVVTVSEFVDMTEEEAKQDASERGYWWRVRWHAEGKDTTSLEHPDNVVPYAHV